MLRPGPLEDRNMVDSLEKVSCKGTALFGSRRGYFRTSRHTTSNIISDNTHSLIGMEDDEDDDIYAPEEGVSSHQEYASIAPIDRPPQAANVPQDEESGEEIDEDDSDSVLQYNILVI